MKTKRIILFLSLALSFMSSIVWAEEGKEIKALDVSGNSRVSTLIILSNIKTKVGDNFSSLVIREDVKRLYGLGYFSDVEVDVTDYKGGVKVTFIVKEEFLIKKINLVGIKALKEKTLREVMVLTTGDVFNKRLLNEDVKKITSLYQEKGYYLVKVKAEVERLNKEQKVIINITIEEGVGVRVKEIKIEGNHSFPGKRIKKIMATRVAGFFTRGVFKEEDFQGDLERIISFYQNQGFIKARIVDTQKRLDKSKGRIYLTIKIEEGPRFEVGKINLKGNALFSDKKLRNELKMLEGDIYSPEGLKQDVARIKVYYAHKGYIFAKVDGETNVEEKEKKVNITYQIVEDGLVYIEMIEIKGNTKTKDKVLRRELTIKPGDIFDARKIERSRQKLYNLGYFDEVSYYITPGSVPNKKNLVFEVGERKTGSFMFGFGYSSVDNFIGFIELSQNNFDIKNPPTFTGGGQKVRIRAQLGTEKTDYDLSFTEPWLFDRPLSFGFDIYNTTRKWTDYDEGRQGGRLRLSYPLGEFTRGSLAYKLEDVGISRVDKDASSQIKQEEGTFTTSSLKMGLIKDTRDNVLDPTNGYKNSISAEIAGGLFGGDRDFTKYIGETSWYFKTFKRWEKLILNLRLKGGLVEEYGDTDYVPIYERFYLGGANSIRGYAYRDIGPKDEKGEPLGGKTFLQFNAEYTYPIVRNIKGAIFFDSGGVWADAWSFDSSGIESGVGIGLRLNLPIGPIRLDYGYGINRGKGRVHFTGGWNF
ncbi:MAG: outer membrane protein assembly factor BamA [Nitrospirae bacterium]|nr:outer membrane protein assembly factor BamA [Nitrospirota bacterium]